jgi:hypothetical protein
MHGRNRIDNKPSLLHRSTQLLYKVMLKLVQRMIEVGQGAKVVCFLL